MLRTLEHFVHPRPVTRKYPYEKRDLPERSRGLIALLLAVAVWCFARFYYFAFYVIEHYVDPGYKFAGLWSFVRYLVRRRKGLPPGRPGNPRADGRRGAGDRGGHDRQCG